MSRVYLDSSSFAKRFVDESGSDTVAEICSEADDIGLSVICLPEVVSALSRRRGERTLTRRQYESAKQRLMEDVRDADIINLTPSVVGSSIAVIERGPLRTLDALHVACALEWEAELFVSSDRRQLVAAKRTGMKTREA